MSTYVRSRPIVHCQCCKEDMKYHMTSTRQKKAFIGNTRRDFNQKLDPSEDEPEDSFLAQRLGEVERLKQERDGGNTTERQSVPDKTIAVWPSVAVTWKLISLVQLSLFFWGCRYKELGPGGNQVHIRLGYVEVNQ